MGRGTSLTSSFPLGFLDWDSTEPLWRTFGSDPRSGSSPEWSMEKSIGQWKVIGLFGGFPDVFLVWFFFCRFPLGWTVPSG